MPELDTLTCKYLRTETVTIIKIGGDAPQIEGKENKMKNKY